jgi:predicted transcriptional regulator of viral defense system
VREHLRGQGRSTLDLKTDWSWLRAITRDPHGLLGDMARRGVAHRIQRGRYVVNVEGAAASDAPLLDALEPLADALLERLGMPYYLSWHTALFHYGLLEQQSSTIFCAVPRRKRSAEFHGFAVRFVTLRHDRFFGIEPASGYGGTVRIATVEKALLDALERPGLTAPFPLVIGAFADAAASGMLDAERLVRYTAELRRPALARRVGFLMDRYGVRGAERLQEHTGSRAYAVPLRPGASRTEGELDARWHLRVPGSLLTTAEQLK